MSDDKKVEQDPEVLAEEKQNRIWHLKMERYKEMAGAVSVILQTFKSEAISLVSGVGTLVVGWFQVRKWVIQGRHEVRAEAAASKPLERVSEMRRPTDKNSEQQYQEVVGMASPAPTPTVLGDPMTYVPVLTLLVFVWSSLAAWAKRKRKISDLGGK